MWCAGGRKEALWEKVWQNWPLPPATTLARRAPAAVEAQGQQGVFFPSRLAIRSAICIGIATNCFPPGLRCPPPPRPSLLFYFIFFSPHNTTVIFHRGAYVHCREPFRRLRPQFSFYVLSGQSSQVSFLMSRLRTRLMTACRILGRITRHSSPPSCLLSRNILSRSRATRDWILLLLVCWKPHC